MEPQVISTSRRQRGTALFVALIMLVAMSIAAVSLVRSVDTTVVISGNLAFQQAALQAADFGIEAAVNDLDSKTKDDEWKVGVKCPGASDPTTDNYFPTMFERTSDSSKIGKPKIGGITYSYPGVPSLDWSTVSCVQNAKIPPGYSVQYVIDRLCTGPLVSNKAEQCISNNPEEGGSKSAGKPIFRGAQSILYRLTVRVSGPNNAQSFVQVTLRD